MAQDYTIGIGTVGAGLWFSYDRGDNWRHIYKHLNPEGSVRALQVDPNDPHRILAGSDMAGLFLTEDNGYRWFPFDSPITDCAIWSLEFDPADSNRIFVGTRPGVHRSTDGGSTWSQLDLGAPDECPIGSPRTTNLVVDPRDSSTVWAGIEVDGLYRSDDGGDTWRHLADLGPTPFHGDVHGFAVRAHDGTAEMFASTPFGLATSADEGESWSWQEFAGFDKGSGNPYAYCRGVFVQPGNPDTVLVGVGDYIPGRVGAIEVSRDGGQSFTRADLPVEPNATVYWMAMHPDVPDVIAATTIFGQVFVSENAGETWSKLDREFGEVRSITLTPN